MHNKKPYLFPNPFLSELRIINGIKFTHREIDIIAFLICGRAVKKIASFFSIAPKTVENHTHNVMIKLGCNSREGIIDFIEKSGKLLILRRYYATLIAQASFEKSLNEIAQLTKEKIYSCILTYWEEEAVNLLASQLEESLKTAKINVLLTPRIPSQSFEFPCTENYVVYITPETQDGLSLNNQEAVLLSKHPRSVLFFSPNEQEPKKISKYFEKDNFLNYITNNYYYFLTFEILKNLIPSSTIEKIIIDFEKQYEIIKRSVEQINTSLNLERDEKSEEVTLKDQITFFQIVKPLSLTFLLFVFGVIIISYVEFKSKKGLQIFAQNSSLQKIQRSESASVIRSELMIPTDTTLLSRSRLISLIDERFKDWRGIQAIALVGMGGAGKTTLARQYARQQQADIIWEVNAETKETLNEAFEDLADRLAITPEDQRILTGIIKLKDFDKREEKIVQFVKEKLRTYQNWFLVYDNVEKFADIQNHFPKDPGSWGQGRIILTTQDNNIENNKYVNNTIIINELSTEEKFSLFTKIMRNGRAISFTKQIEKIKKFLAAIPPFPLDISVAAYYLKATNTSYQSYLDKMHKYDHNFSNAQEKILRGAGDDYIKTRYQIVTVSLRHLIDKDKNFKNLLYFICLLDPQNISRDLILKYKAENIVDELTYYLKKYSLIVNKNMVPDNLNSFFTMHRSTQNIILAYLTDVLKLNEDRALVQSFARVLENDMSDAIEKEDFTKMKSLFRHAEHFIGKSNGLNHTTRSSLWGELGCICYYLCYYPRAEELLRLGISELNTSPTKDNAKIAHFLVYLGNIYRRLGDYKQSMQLFEKGIELYKQSSKLHVGMARAYGYLGIAYESLGAFEKAKSLLEKSLSIHKRFSKNKIGHAWSLAHLGSVYKNIGDYLKAKELYEESLYLYKFSSPYHVGVAWVCRDLGFIYATLGDKEKAKHFLEESLLIYRKHFFEDHIYVAHAVINLGIFYREAKDFEKAKSLLKKGLVVIEKTYGKNHADTGSVLKEMGKTFLAEGNLKGAEDMMNQAYSIFTKTKHPDKYEALEILASVYQKKSLIISNGGKTPDAIRLEAQARTYLLQALEIAKTYFPAGSPHHIRIQSKIKNEGQSRG